MPNGKELINELEYKERIKGLSEPEKLNYVVDKLYDLHLAIIDCKPISRKQQLSVSGVTSFVVSVIIGVISYFRGS